MIISLIVAVSQNQVIGKDNRLLWKIADDLKRFKSLTTGHNILMGRKTFESLGRPLPNRTNIIITRNKDYTCEHDNVHVFNTINKGIEFAKTNGETELFIIGGGQIYAQSMDIAHRIYITTVHTTIDGDTYFPEDKKTFKKKNLDTTYTWKKTGPIERFKKDERNEYDFDFQILERKDKNVAKDISLSLFDN